jgi:ABC-type glutathione transport system ATPase component
MAGGFSLAKSEKRVANSASEGLDNHMSEAAGIPLIEIENMTKVFYTDEVETHALSGVHLMVRKGEYVAMSGPSGCGKSTLLSIIGLLDTPTTGKYNLNGHRWRTWISATARASAIARSVSSSRVST